MADISVNVTVDCKGLSCPMPIVRTKKAMDQLEAGQVIEVLATDRGSLADMQGWAKNTGHQYLGTLEDGEVLKHYLRKSRLEELKEAANYPHTATNKELQSKLAASEALVILDVREPAEYAFSHIPRAVSIPLGDMEARLSELDPEDSIYVVCRTGSRSDLACHLLAEHGFQHVSNVVPGMSAWTGPIENQ